MKAVVFVWGSLALTVFLLVCTLLVVAAGVGPLGERSDEPTVEGRPVRAWLHDLKGDSDEVRLRAAEALDRLGPDNTDAIPVLTEGLRDDDRTVRICCARGLGLIGPKARPALPELDAAMATSTGPELRAILGAERRIERLR